jgi:hypothetical protein
MALKLTQAVEAVAPERRRSKEHRSKTPIGIQVLWSLRVVA